jgi:CHAT domain-containing protein
LTLKTTTIYFTAFFASAILLMTPAPLAREQGERGRGEHPSPSTASQAEALFQNALLLFDKQESEPARLQLQEAMRLWVALREPGKAAKAALQMGDRFKQAGKYQEALDHYAKARDVESLPGAVRADALNAIALVYAELYLHDMAEDYFSQALEAAHAGGDLPAQVRALTGLGELYHQQGLTEKALRCVTRALQLSKQGHAEDDPALLYLQGQMSQKQGSFENAKGAFEAALATYRKAGDTAGQVKILCALSSLSLLVSQKQAALEQAGEAVDLADKEGNRSPNMTDQINALKLRWPAYLNRARAERALGEKKHAQKSYFWAVNLFKAVWWPVYLATEAGAVASREEAQAAYREYVDLLMEQGEFKEAYNLADEAKGRTLLNFIGAQQKNPPSKDSKYAAPLRELSESIARRRSQLLAENLGPEQQAKVQKEIEGDESKVREIQLQDEMAHAKERLVWTPPALAEDLQKQMAGDQVALAEFSLGENHSFVWLFARGEVYYEILPPRQEIEKAVRPYLDSLAAAPNALFIQRDIAKLRGQAEGLFTTLFGRLAPQVEAAPRLIVVPDGLLHYLPFEALMHDGRYLIEEHEISYDPSASLLGLWQDSGSRVDGGDKLELLAVGDPVFEPKAPAAGKRPRNGSHKPARLTLTARGFGLAPLPRTRDEVQQIAGLFPADRRRVLLGSESTESAIKHEPLRRYRRLHFATHSLIDEQNPARSAVVLTPDDGAGEDGFLEASEIARLGLDCDLAVVSACQTGRGKLLSGEGVVGLSRAFLYAGARTVVVSLWNVSDISTAQFMKNFYQDLTGGMANAAALRRAKLQMLNGGQQTRHPYYWSSFVMIGKP